MSTGIAHDSSDDNSISLGDQLIAATRAGNMENIREILSQKIGRHRVRTALYLAARGGSVMACRLLWGKLNRCGKQKYFKATIDGYGLLHAAVESGHLEVVLLFINEFKLNINQINKYGRTPLCFAAAQDSQEMARFLLENGANVNLGECGPLWYAVSANNKDVARLLLVEYHANPNLNQSPVDEEEAYRQGFCRNTDLAIMCGKSRMLRMLLEHGAFIGFVHTRWGSKLNSLFRSFLTRKRKLTICRILLEHALNDHATAEFLRLSFESAIKLTQNEGCRILLEAGFIPSTNALYSAIHHENLALCELLVRNQVDPFLQHEEDGDNINGTTAASPFLASARLPNTKLFEYFLGVWDERFSSTGGGKNSDGDYPIHVICCDPQISLQAIQLLVQRHPDTLAVVDGEQGLLPFHFAANWGTSLDIIFYLLQHCPSALHHVGNATSTVVVAAGVAASGPSSSFATTVGASDSTNASTGSEEDNKQTRGPAQKKTKTTHSR